MASAAVLTSAHGVLALLEEPEPEVKSHALRLLNDLVQHHWPAISEHVASIEALHDDDAFPERGLAALLASKVYYHLEELDDALKYALGAGDLFDINDRSEFAETLVSKCIDAYIEARSAGDGGEEAKIDPRLEHVVERMFERCYADKEYKQALGIALETRRLDEVRRSIELSPDKDVMLSYLFTLTQRVVKDRKFRRDALLVLVELYEGRAQPDYLSMATCYLFLNDAKAVAGVLQSLLADGNVLMAYQIGFDLQDNARFAASVRSALAPPPAPAALAANANDDNNNDTIEGGNAAPAEKEKEEEDAPPQDPNMVEMRRILSGERPAELYLNFLYSACKTDLNILQQIKDKLDDRNTLTREATVVAHAFMNCGTTVDTFLKDNMDWLKKNSNWAKFTATASLGVIHKNHYKKALKLLQPYLPAAGAAGPSGQSYSEAGALFALGLCSAQQPSETAYLREALLNASGDEVLLHGASLGLGLSALGTHDQALYTQLKETIFQDNAVASEGAAYAAGLVMLGSGDAEATEELFAYARDTQHDKIRRGAAMALALIHYSREDAAEGLVEQLLADKDPMLRYSGVYTLAMAYVGTSSNNAVRKLLHVAVSDVSDDVRRASVLALGFVLCGEPEQVPGVVGLLSESHSFQTRIGAAYAVGIACAGTGSKAALDLLRPLIKDNNDHVRQAALIAKAMLLLQLNDVQEPEVREFRELLAELHNRKGAGTMTKVGAILAAGVLDACGRNATLSLLSPTGLRKPAAVAGLALFTHSYFWFPLRHFISLAFTPTAVIGLNEKLEIPANFEFVCRAPPSLFAYTKPVEVKVEEKKAKVATAVLSVTAKAQAKAKKKEDGDTDGGGEAKRMDVEEEEEKEKKKKTTTKKKEDDDGVPLSQDAVKKLAKHEKRDSAFALAKDERDELADAMDVDGDDDDGDEKEEEKEVKEPSFTILKNPCRVTFSQRPLIVLQRDQRYTPVKPQLAGIVMLRDGSPDEPTQVYEQKAPVTTVPGVSADEPHPPAPFTFNG